MFKRENLQNNAYLIYRMNNNLETPFAVIFNEFKIKSITTDYAFFLNVKLILIIILLIILNKGVKTSQKFGGRL